MTETLILLAVLIASITWYVICCRRSGTTLGKQILKQSSPASPGTTTTASATETIHAPRQPGDGYWAIAPGASDISEGMVWVKTNVTTEGESETINHAPSIA